MKKVFLILSVLSLTVISCKNEKDSTLAQENEEHLEISAEEELQNIVNRSEAPSLQEYKSNVYPVILEVGEKHNWTLIMHVAKKAHEAPNEEIFKANYNDLSVLLEKNLSKL